MALTKDTKCKLEDNMKNVWICPVCVGKGIVPNNFYMGTSKNWSSSSATPETCRSCNGRGIIFEVIDI